MVKLIEKMYLIHCDNMNNVTETMTQYFSAPFTQESILMAVLAGMKEVNEEHKNESWITWYATEDLDLFKRMRDAFL